jgi:hypothetical protein
MGRRRQPVLQAFQLEDPPGAEGRRPAWGPRGPGRGNSGCTPPAAEHGSVPFKKVVRERGLTPTAFRR